MYFITFTLYIGKSPPEWKSKNIQFAINLDQSVDHDIFFFFSFLNFFGELQLISIVFYFIIKQRCDVEVKRSLGPFHFCCYNKETINVYGIPLHDNDTRRITTNTTVTATNNRNKWSIIGIFHNSSFWDSESVYFYIRSRGR